MLSYSIGNIDKLGIKYNVNPWAIPKENRIYIRGEFTRKKCKTVILLYCFHTAGVLHIFGPWNIIL